MTETRRNPLSERRKARQARTAAASEAHWEVRFAAATTPLEGTRAAWELFRTRCIQRERKAAARVERAKPGQDRDAAEQKLAATRAQIARACETAAKELARLTDQIETERR